MGMSNYSAAVKGNAALALSGGPTGRLNTLENTRKSLARVCRMYAHMDIPPEYFRNLCYGLNSLVTAWKTEFELVDVQRQIDEIKAMLEVANHGKD